MPILPFQGILLQDLSRKVQEIEDGDFFMRLDCTSTNMVGDLTFPPVVLNPDYLRCVFECFNHFAGLMGSLDTTTLSGSQDDFAIDEFTNT